MLLGLFAAALDGDALAVRRIAATLLAEAAPRAAAAEWVALRFVQAPLVQRD